VTAITRVSGRAAMPGVHSSGGVTHRLAGLTLVQAVVAAGSGGAAALAPAGDGDGEGAAAVEVAITWHAAIDAAAAAAPAVLAVPIYASASRARQLAELNAAVVHAQPAELLLRGAAFIVS